MKTKFFFLSALCGLALYGLQPSDANAAIARLALVGDVSYNVYSQDFSPGGSVNYKGSGTLGYGGGALLDFGMAHGVGLEIGGIWFKRKTNFDLGAGTDPATVITGGTQEQIHIPLLLRIGLGSVFSVAAGGFYEFPTDDTDRVKNYGVEGGIRVSIPVGGPTAIIADARYAYGLRDFDFGAGNFKTNDFHGLVGLSFGGR